MTFVAQPYEHFVDDLLTALTGGVVREEHRFTGREEIYSLSRPKPILSTIKVFGQREEAFTLFTGGIDYQYDSETSGIKWKENALVPDDHSYFYINYYPEEHRYVLTDRNPGSVTTTLTEAFAREFAVLHQQMDLIYRSAFSDLASGSSLDHVAALLGLSRKDARFANGEVLFKRSTPAPGDIAIPSLTLVSAEQGQVFETSDKRTLRKDQLSVIAPIRAQIEGPSGRVEAGAINIINRPIFGIEAVINETATFFANEKETDDEFRRRIKGTLERAGKASLDAIKYSLIEDIPEVTENNIQIAERAEMPGFVDVKFGLEAAGDADLVNRIEKSILSCRAAGVRIAHNLSTQTASESSQTAEAQQSTAREEAVQRFAKQGEPITAVDLPANVLSGMPEGIMTLKAEVLLQLTERNLSASAKESIHDKVRSQLQQYIEALPMGSHLIYNKVLGQIMQFEEILDATMLVGPTGNGELYKSNIAMDGRKAKIDINNIFVGLMEETVFLDCFVLLESKNANGNAEISLTLQQESENAINSVLAGTREKLPKESLKTELRKAITVKSPELQFIAGNAVIMNAEYEETGRLLNNTDEIAIAENQKIKLRKLDMKLKGVLDG